MAEPKSLDQIRGEYKQWIKKASTEFGLNPNVVLSLIAHESRGDQYAIGGSGEWGLTQLMPDTARGIADSLGVKYESPEDLKKMLLEKPGLNIAFGAKYYSDQLKRANGDHVMAYSMYNAGPAYNKNRPDVWSKISAGDMSGTDQISTNANNFLGKMLETGYDPSSRSWPGYAADTPAGGEVPDFASSMDSYGKFREGLTPDGGAPQGDLVGSQSALQPDTRYNPQSRAELNAEDWWNPVARGYGGLTKGLTAGYVNPMEGMDQYAEPGTINERIGRWSELTGEGVGIAAPFAVGSGVAGLAGRGLTAAIPGLARAGALAPVAKSAASMALYEAAAKGAGSTEQGAPLYAEDAPLQDKVIAQLRERAPEALRGLGVGAALGAFHMVPGVRQLAERPWGKPIVTAGALTGLASGEQAMHGEPVTWGANLENAIPMSIGMTIGNAIAENVRPTSAAEFALARAARARAAAAEQLAASDAQARRLIPAQSSKIFVEPSREMRPEDVYADRAPTNYTDESPAIVGKPTEGARTRRTQDLPADSPQTSVGGRVWRSRANNVDDAMGILADLASGAITPVEAQSLLSGIKYPGQPIRVGRTAPKAADDGLSRPSNVEASPQTARGGRVFTSPQGAPQADLPSAARAAARMGRSELEAMRRGDKGVDPTVDREGAGVRRSVTADFMGGQQAYEYISGKIHDALSRRGAAKEAKIRELTDKILSDESFHADVLRARGINPNVAGVNVSPVAGNPITQVMSRALRGEISLEQVISEFKSNPDAFSIDPAVSALVKDLATRQQAGEVNLPEGRSAFRDRRRFVREATGGEAENPAYREMIRVGETTEMFKEWMKGELDSRMLNALGEVKSQPDSEALGRFLDKWKRDVPAEVFAQTEDGMKALSGARNPEAVVRAAAPVAQELGFQRGIRNDVREMFAKEGKGGDPAFEEMGNIESYFPHTEKRIGFFKNPKVWLEQSTRPIKQGEQRPGKRVYSAHERQRKGMLTEDKIDWSALDVIGKYNADTARVLSNSIALNAGENLAQVYRDAGLKGTADGLSLVNQQSYGGKMSPISKFYGASRGGVAAMNTALAMKQAFNSATYAFNIPFMALRQWTSVGLTAAHGEITPKDVGWAIANMNSAKIRGEFKDSYTGWIKNRGRGSLTRQGSLRTDFLNEKLGGKSGFVDFMRELPNAPVSGMENVTGRFAFALAERIGMKAGLKGEMLDGFKSDVAGLTQSYYDSLNRAPILNDPFLNLLFPAQGYSVEVANTYRSAARGETGAQRGRASKTQRAARVFNLAMTTYLLNLAYTYMVGYKGDERGIEALADPELHLDNAFSVATGSIPYLPSVLGMGPSKGMTMPSQRMKEFEKAVGQMSDGDWELALAEISKKQVPAGGAMNRIIQAQKMYDDGKITEDDLITAMILGWYTTESGKDYLQKVSRQGVVKDILLGEEESGSKPSTSRRAPTAKRPTRRSNPGR